MLGGSAFKEGIKLKWVPVGGTYSTLTGVRENSNTHNDIPERRVRRGKTMWGHRREAAICKPAREASGELEPANPLILDFLPPELWENRFVLFKSPGLYSVMAALAN